MGSCRQVHLTDRRATQMFSLRNVLTGYTGKVLTPETVEKILDVIDEEIECGTTAWAFKP